MGNENYWFNELKTEYLPDWANFVARFIRPKGQANKPHLQNTTLKKD